MRISDWSSDVCSSDLVKVVVDDGAYPALDDLAADLATAHRAARHVAVHCVTRTALVLALAAWDIAGSNPGDRIENGAVVPPELMARTRPTRPPVETQPGFVAYIRGKTRTDPTTNNMPNLPP